VSNLKEYFHTDWTAMSFSDWIGLIVTIGITLLMVWAYVYVFHPKNKEKLESQRHLPDDEDRNDSEEKK